MKIALLVPGGVDRTGEDRSIPVLLWLIERLARVHELHVFALRQEARPCIYPLLGATVHNIGARPRSARMIRSILAEHRRTPFDVLHAYWAGPQGAIAGVVSQRTGVPVLLHLNGGDLVAMPDIEFGGLRSRRARVAFRYAVRRASLITVSSRPMQRRAAQLGVSVELLPFGVALDRWPARAPRRELSQPPRLLHVGTLNRVKDQRTLLRALAHLRTTHEFALDVVGEDTLGGAVQRLAAELGLGDTVRFHGQVPHTELRPFFDNADLLVMSSRHEADPIVALEAAVAGVPVVGTAVGLIDDWSPHAARAVPVQDHLALAAAISDLLQDSEARMSIAGNAQAIVRAHDADAMTAAVQRQYEALRTREAQ